MSEDNGVILVACGRTVLIGTEFSGIYIARLDDLLELLRGKRRDVPIFYKGNQWQYTPNINQFVRHEETGEEVEK